MSSSLKRWEKAAASNRGKAAASVASVAMALATCIVESSVVAVAAVTPPTAADEQRSFLRILGQSRGDVDPHLRSSKEAVCWVAEMDREFDRAGFVSDDGGGSSGESLNGNKAEAAMSALHREWMCLEEEFYRGERPSICDRNDTRQYVSTGDYEHAIASMDPSCRDDSLSLSISFEEAWPPPDRPYPAPSRLSGIAAAAYEGTTVIYAGSDRDVRVKLEVNLSDIVDEKVLIPFPDMDNATAAVLTPLRPQHREGQGEYLENVTGTAWFRFVLCDDTIAGFCHPFLYDSSNSLDDNNDVARSNDNDKETVMEVAAGDSSRMLSRTIVLDLLASNEDSGADTNADANAGANGTEKASRTMEGSAPSVWKANETLTMRLPPSLTGRFTLMGHATVFLRAPDDSESVVRLRVDIANVIPGQTIILKDEPTIQTITLGFAIAMGVLLSLCCGWEAFLLYSIWRHRANTAMRVSQGPFLALLVCGCGVATASSIFFMPLNDAFCNLWGPMILIPGTLVGAVLVGLLWRTHCVLDTVLSFGLDGMAKQKPAVMKFLSLLADWNTVFCLTQCGMVEKKGDSFYRKNSARLNLRATVTSKHLLRLVVMLTLPQCILQVIKVTVWPEQVRVDFSDDGSSGRAICTREGIWMSFFGIIFLAAIFLLAIFVSWYASNLPSVFNDKQSIFTASWISTVLLMFGGGLILITEILAASPNVLALLSMLLVSSICLLTSWLLVMPKLQQIWSGEPIIVSNLVRAALHHGQSIQSIGQLQADKSSEINETPSLPAGTEEAVGSGLHPSNVTQKDRIEMPKSMAGKGTTTLTSLSDNDVMLAGTTNLAPPSFNNGISAGLEELKRGVTWDKKMEDEQVMDDDASFGSHSSADSFDVEGLETIEKKMQRHGFMARDNKETPFPPLGDKHSLRSCSNEPTSNRVEPQPVIEHGAPSLNSFGPAASATGLEEHDPLTLLNQIDMKRNVTTGAFIRTNRYRGDTKIRLKRTSAPPKGLEMRLLKMREAITHVTTATLEGRQAPLKVWKTLQMDAMALSSQLQNIEFGWTESDESGTQKNKKNINFVRNAALHLRGSGNELKNDSQDSVSNNGFHRTSSADGLRNLRQNFAALHFRGSGNEVKNDSQDSSAKNGVNRTASADGLRHLQQHFARMNSNDVREPMKKTLRKRNSLTGSH